jgi:hypothetical protein
MPTEIQLKTAIADLSVQRIEQILAEPRFRNSMQASDKQSCRLLVQLNTRLALSSADGVRRLVRLATSSSKKQAIRASVALFGLAGINENLAVREIQPLADSQYSGVRRNWIEALIKVVDAHKAVSEAEFNEICNSFLVEKHRLVINRLHEFAMHWIRTNKRITRSAAEAIAFSMRELLKEQNIDDGIVRSLLITFKILAQMEVRELAADLRSWVQELVSFVNVGKASNGESEAIDLFTALERLSPGFLVEIAQKCQHFPPRNIRAILAAIKRVEGPNSQVIANILHAEWCPPEVKAFILSFHRI